MVRLSRWYYMDIRTRLLYILGAFTEQKNLQWMKLMAYTACHEKHLDPSSRQ